VPVLASLVERLGPSPDRRNAIGQLKKLRTRFRALYASRIVARDVFELRTADIFNAATLGGAAALQRDDIGRLSVAPRPTS
jgi:hypothetical protein